MSAFDFDRFDDWHPILSAELADLLPQDIGDRVRRKNPEFIEDAGDFVLSRGDREAMRTRVADWLKSDAVYGYHGTKLTEAERDAILANGLKPLVAADRSARLQRALSRHPRWADVAHRVGEAIELYGAKERGGRREGQVHLTVSRAGLTQGFNHYIKQGSEFDWHAAAYVLGDEGQALIAADGDPYLVKLKVPGEIAFKAYNPYGFSKEDGPNLVRQVIDVWSYRFVDPSYSSARRGLDCGMIFYETVPAAWIEAVEPLNVEELDGPS